MRISPYLGEWTSLVLRMDWVAAIKPHTRGMDNGLCEFRLVFFD